MYYKQCMISWLGLSLEHEPKWQSVQWLVPTKPIPHYGLPPKIEFGQKWLGRRDTWTGIWELHAACHLVRALLFSIIFMRAFDFFATKDLSFKSYCRDLSNNRFNGSLSNLIKIIHLQVLWIALSYLFLAIPLNFFQFGE